MILLIGSTCSSNYFRFVGKIYTEDQIEPMGVWKMLNGQMDMDNQAEQMPTKKQKQKIYE